MNIIVNYTGNEFMEAFLLSDDATSLVTNIGEDAFNAAFAKCPVVRGFRAVYIRTTLIPTSFNAFDIFANSWSSKNNRINHDFKLYNSIEEAKSGTNPWQYCDYDDAFVGFPRNCGPTGPVRGHKFFTMPGTRFSKNVGAATSNNGLEIYTGGDCPASVSTKGE